MSRRKLFRNPKRLNTPQPYLSRESIHVRVPQFTEWPSCGLRKVVYEEFGRKARYYRADYHYAVITACVSLGIPFMSWEYIIPGNTDSTDYEWDDKQATWPVMVYGVLLANETPGAFSWPNLDLCSVA